MTLLANVSRRVVPLPHKSLEFCSMKGMMTIMGAILFQAGEAAKLAGITANQLREWTGRRAIISPDVPGRGRGKHALFGPTTVLVLRILGELHARFHVEVGALSSLAERLRSDLGAAPFISLYGRAVAITDLADCEIITLSQTRITKAVVIIPFESHLIAISETSELRDQIMQFQLFPAISA